MGSVKSVKCIDCGVEFNVSIDTFRIQNKKENPEFRCKKCRYEYISNLGKKRWEDRSDSDKEKERLRLSNIHKKWYDNLSEEEKIIHSKKMSDTNKKTWSNKDIHHKRKLAMGERNRNRYNNMTDEEKSIWLEKLLKGGVEWRNSLSDEELDKISKEKSIRGKEWWDNLSEEDKQLWSQRTIEQWQNMTPEDRNIFINKLSDAWVNKSEDEMRVISGKHSIAGKIFWKSLSDYEKNKILNRLHEASIKRFENIDENEMIHIMGKIWKGRDEWLSKSENKKILSEKAKRNWEIKTEEEKMKVSQKFREIWNNKSNEIKNRIIHMSLTKKKKNSLQIKFENEFIETFGSFITFKAEFVVNFGDIRHSWDYAIFKDNNMIAVVDLDGRFYHGDGFDYDGIHGKREYDQLRTLLIPDQTLWFIIQENNFDDCFKYFKDHINYSYEEYINCLYKELSSMPFPYPQYSDIELMRSWSILQRMDPDNVYRRDLSLNSRLGDILIYNFHPQIWSDNGIIDLWKNDLLNIIKLHKIIYMPINKNKLLQDFNVDFMSASKAKMLIHKYLNKYNSIFDPTPCYGGRMLAAISLNKKYIYGVKDDRNSSMIDFLAKYNVTSDIEFMSKMNNKDTALFTEASSDIEINYIKSNNICNEYLFVTDFKSEDYCAIEIIKSRSIFEKDKYVYLIKQDDVASRD